MGQREPSTFSWALGFDVVFPKSVEEAASRCLKISGKERVLASSIMVMLSRSARLQPEMPSLPLPSLLVVRLLLLRCPLRLVF